MPSKCPFTSEEAAAFRYLGYVYPAANTCCRALHPGAPDHGEFDEKRNSAVLEIYQLIPKDKLFADFSSYSKLALYLWHYPPTRAILDKYGIAIETDAPVSRRDHLRPPTGVVQ